MIHDVTFELPPDLDINAEGDLLLFDKPYKCTSFDVVGKVRKQVQRAVGHRVKVGHAGTLDPLATGLLLICVGKMTKHPYEHITRKMAEDAARSFTGDIQQVPPIFSAVKHQGERSYEIARRGEEAQLTAKNITIYEFEITRFELPEIDFRIRCSKGTYIRAIARDFGAALNSGAHLTALRRTRIGSLCVEDAIRPEIRER